MSVVMIDNKVYELVLAKLYDYTTKPDSIGSDRNEQVKHLTRTFIEDETILFLKVMVTDWCKLNELTYCRKYKQEFTGEFKGIKLKGFNDIKKIDTMQFIKYLECIKYQIEWCYLTQATDKNYRKSYNHLELILADAKDKIIKSLPAYDKCEWWNPVK
jgi:hypothetical protein